VDVREIVKTDSLLSHNTVGRRVLSASVRKGEILDDCYLGGDG
jgi:hypothetical protein